MSLGELWELLIKFVNRIKPSVESLLVGAILAGLAAVTDYLFNLVANSGNGQPLNAFLTGQTALLVFGGAFINFITSTIRRIYARREIVKAAVTGETPAPVVAQVKEDTKGN